MEVMVVVVVDQVSAIFTAVVTSIPIVLHMFLPPIHVTLLTIVIVLWLVVILDICTGAVFNRNKVYCICMDTIYFD